MKLRLLIARGFGGICIGSIAAYFVQKEFFLSLAAITGTLALLALLTPESGFGSETAKGKIDTSTAAEAAINPDKLP